MRSPEVVDRVEARQEKLGALIVLGKNVGVRDNPESLRNKYTNLVDLRTRRPRPEVALEALEPDLRTRRPRPEVALGPISLESALNVIAAGKLYNRGLTERIIFSTGHTAGDDLPSEAEAMRYLLKEIYPEIPDSAIILEERSKDTSGNAEEVNKIIRLNNFKPVGLVDVGFHLKNAVTLFRRYGVEIADVHCFASEKMVATRAKDPNLFPDKYNNHPIVKKEKLKETIRIILLNTIDRNGKLLRKVAKLTRK